jgi:asparagine synthase (glutamine-hydrolysing)
MCGFAGVVAWDDRYRVNRETLSRMSARIAHRGPDGEGIHLNHAQEVRPDRPQVGLAFRRLAILDPDPRADQPFTDRDGRWMVFNGEIYNFRELRAELSQIHPNYQWRTNGDTEVLLQSYATWGEACLQRLNGMYAIAIWDEPKKELFLARDRMGQKPLYYALVANSGIAFASELPALTVVPWIDKAIDERSIAHYLSWGYSGAPRTIYRNIRALRPAAFMSVSMATRWEERTHGYFDANGGVATADPVAQTRRLLLQAAKRQIVSDVPIGCFLSGGVDSSIAAMAMKRAVGAGGEVQTFSIGFDDPRYDERGYAQRIAEHLGTRHRSFVVKPNAAADLPKLAAVFGEPFADSSALPTHYLARETRNFVKVALSGDGGDELFGGYDRYRAMSLGERVRHLPHFVHQMFWFPFSVGWIRQTHPKSRAARAARFMTSVRMAPPRRYSKYVRMFDEPVMQELLRGGWPRKDRRAVECEIVGAFRQFLRNGRDVVQAALAVDRLTYLPEDLLTKVDRASMLHALEVRSPYMDHELVQFAAGLTTDQLLKGGPKRMLREAFAADLPDWVFKRRKMGFAVPIGEWFRGELRPMLHDHLFATNSFAGTHFNKPVIERLVQEHEQERVDHSQRLYALLMLELWWKTQNSS